MGKVAQFSPFWLCAAACWTLNKTMSVRLKSRLSALVFLFTPIFGEVWDSWLSIRTVILNTWGKSQKRHL